MNGINDLSKIPPILWIIIVFALLTQGVWIFYDASRRGENKWLWGLYGLIQVPSSLIVYLIVTRKFLKTKNCTVCERNIRVDSVYCPYCGEKVKD